MKPAGKSTKGRAKSVPGVWLRPAACIGTASAEHCPHNNRKSARPGMHPVCHTCMVMQAPHTSHLHLSHRQLSNSLHCLLWLQTFDRVSYLIYPCRRRSSTLNAVDFTPLRATSIGAPNASRIRAYEAITCRRSVDAVTSGQGALLMQKSKRLQAKAIVTKNSIALQGCRPQINVFCEASESSKHEEVTDTPPSSGIATWVKLPV